MKGYQKTAIEVILLTLLMLGFDLIIDNYLFFHVIVELFSIVILFVLFAITWNARKFLDNRYLLFVGIAAGFIGVLDLLHTLTYKGMNIIHSPLFYANQFWIATRFFESIALLTGFIFVSKKHYIKISYLFLIYSILTIGIIASILHFKNFPTCFIENVGQTAFKIYSEYVIICILILALIMLVRNKRFFESDTYLLIKASIILTIASEFCFTLYVANYDYINKVGHIFKVLSFYMIYKANIQHGFNKPFETFFKNIKSSEEKIRIYSQELEKQIATKNKFFSIISHDLKNPFAVLVGITELLLKNYSKYNDKEREKLIEAVYNTSEKTHRLLENLLQWSRTQTNTIPINPVKFDIKSILDENVLFILNHASLKDIEIIKIYSCEWVRADFEMIGTVIRNLLSNAVKFTPKSGTVTIQTVSGDGFVNVDIIDTGVGISEEKIDLLFKIDKTFSTKGTDNETGTGLGLVLCAEFIAQNGGKLKVESQVNKGSKFSFTIPIA